MNVSFSKTIEQVRAGTKTVTRRLKWRIKPGDQFDAIEKGQGLSKGAHVVKIRTMECVSVRQEPLCVLTEDLRYGYAEMVLEGFFEMQPIQFTRMFCAMNHCDADQIIYRIEFKYIT